MKRWVLPLVLAACGGSSTPPPKATDVPTALPQLPAPDHAKYDAPTAVPPAMTSSGNELRLTPIDQRTFLTAQQAYNDGRFISAKRLLAPLVVAYPDREELVADFNAVQQQLATAQSIARASLDSHGVITLAAPPAVYSLAHAANVSATPIPKVTLKSRAKNEIIDEEKWFVKNDLELPQYVPPAQDDVVFFGVTLTITSANAVQQLSGYGVAEWERSRRFLASDLPTWLPVSYGTIPLTHAIDSKPFTIAIYGGRLLAVFDESKQARGLFDFDAFVHPPANQTGQAKIGTATFRADGSRGPTTQQFDITTQTNTISHELRWALAKDHTLFVEHSNMGYAKDSKGQNAYITALDLDTGDLAWRSQPLVSNAENFVLIGGAVVAGYGFTAEPDFLYVLDAATGAIKQKTLLPSGPDAFVTKGSRLFVRTYDNDLTFEVH